MGGASRKQGGRRKERERICSLGGMCATSHLCRFPSIRLSCSVCARRGVRGVVLSIGARTPVKDPTIQCRTHANVTAPLHVGVDLRVRVRPLHEA